MYTTRFEVTQGSLSAAAEGSTALDQVGDRPGTRNYGRDCDVNWSDLLERNQSSRRTAIRLPRAGQEMGCAGGRPVSLVGSMPEKTTGVLEQSPRNLPIDSPF